MKTLIDTNKLVILFQTFVHSDFTRAEMGGPSHTSPACIGMQRGPRRSCSTDEQSAAVRTAGSVVLALPLPLAENVHSGAQGEAQSRRNLSCQHSKITTFNILLFAFLVFVVRKLN